MLQEPEAVWQQLSQLHGADGHTVGAIVEHGLFGAGTCALVCGLLWRREEQLCGEDSFAWGKTAKSLAE